MRHPKRGDATVALVHGAAYMEDGVVVKLGTGKDIREFIREKQDQKRHVVASREN